MLTLRDVRFGYTSGREVICGLRGELRAGRVTAMIGPNAAGKTTLLRLMLGQLIPTAGRVVLDGGDVHRLSEPRRARRIAYVPQRGGVHFAFTVRQVVAMGRFVHHDERGVDDALARCELTEHATRPYVELSGGQQQRVVLARAIAQLHGSERCGGGVLLADEPVSAMDPRVQLRTMALLRDLAHESGVAVVVVLHDLNLAARFADDVWLMHAGALSATGPWSDVLTPAHLEPAYDVSVRVVGRTRGDRPVLSMESAATA